MCATPTGGRRQAASSKISESASVSQVVDTVLRLASVMCAGMRPYRSWGVISPIGTTVMARRSESASFDVLSVLTASCS